MGENEYQKFETLCADLNQPTSLVFEHIFETENVELRQAFKDFIDGRLSSTNFKTYLEDKNL